MKITILQANPLIGDFDQAFSTLQQAFIQAREAQSDLIVTSELFLGGYPAQDLWQDPNFQKSIITALDKIKTLTRHYPDIALCLGTPIYTPPTIHNAVQVICNGEVLITQTKQLLPDYDVFNEPRYFTSSDTMTLFTWKDHKIGILICEDAWFTQNPHRYAQNPVDTLNALNPSLILHLSASPYDTTKPPIRREIVAKTAKTCQCPVVMVNQVGLQDDLVFDGGSLICGPSGELWHQSPSWTESCQTLVLQPPTAPLECRFDSDPEGIFNALTLAIRDYVRKSGFHKVVLGLSGGIDSAIVAVLAKEALGPDQVTVLMMPSPYSSESSMSDALALITTLGIHAHTLPISDAYQAAKTQFNTFSSKPLSSLTTENLQSRLRGLTLMAYSNQHDALLLSTGNKSELAMGYCTLYGDMNGALAALGDLYKTQVYALANWINRNTEIIPTAIITKAPSAELRPNQKDQDTLPDYEILDQILTLTLEQNLPKTAIVAQGFDQDLVDWVLKRLHMNEYKRFQAPPIPRVSVKAFGRGRRMPIMRK